jgi:hypothetical protein
MNLLSVSILTLGVFLFSIISCKSRQSSAKLSEAELLNLQLRFKSWVKDTIPKISTTGEFKQREMVLFDDSLFLQIIDNYDLRIDSNFNSKDKSIIYALDLLDRNSLRPKDTFHLSFVIKNYYETPMVPQLVYGYGSEIDKYVVSVKDSVVNYTFIKGNLTDRVANAKADL